MRRPPLARVFKGPLGCWHVRLLGERRLYWFEEWTDALAWAVRMVGA